MNGLIGALLGLGLLLAAGGWWFDESLPAHEALLPDTDRAPVQEAVKKAPIRTTAGGVDYTVEPLFSYDIRGVVVSRHDAGSWLDYLHARWNDNLNVADLCVIWGNNTLPTVYEHVRNDIAFSSGQFTCNFRTRSREAWEAFDTASISNNHLLAGDEFLAEAIRGARVGDQVHIRGYLSRYGNDQGFSRGTSTVRTDMGNGACETIWVESFEVLAEGPAGPRIAKWTGLLMLAVGLVAWMMAPVRVRQR